MKQFFKVLGKGLCYVGVFIGVQAIVANGILFYYSIMMQVNLAQNGTDISIADMQVILNDKLEKYSSLIILISDVIAVIFIYILFKARHKKIRVEIQLKPISWKSVPLLCVLGVSLCYFISYVMVILPIPESVMESYTQQSSSLSEVSLLVFLATVIAAPLAEEIFCRGLMLSRFQKGMPITVAIILQGIIFGLIHGHPLWIAYASFGGIIFGVIAYKQGSIIGTMVMHAVFNTTSMLITAMQLGESNTIVCVIIVVISGVVFVATGIVLLKDTGIQKLEECLGKDKMGRISFDMKDVEQ